MEQGWIRQNRSDMEDPVIWDTPEPYDRRSAWSYLNMKANHEDRDIRIDSDIVTVHRGQHYTSIRKLADKWHWSRDRVSRYLDLLTKAGRIITDRTPNGTLITLVNYDIEQGSCATDKSTVGTPARPQTMHKQQYNNYNHYKQIEQNISAPPDEDGEWQ